MTLRTWLAFALAGMAVAALVGIGSLAADAGRANAERRRAKAAADDAALAWASAVLQAGHGGMYDLHDARAAIPAYNALADHGYYNIPGQVLIDVAWPPASGAYQCVGGGADDACYKHFQVILHSRVAPVLPRWIYGVIPGGVLDSLAEGQVITVEAVAWAVPPRGISPGNALVTTRRDACLGINFRGGADVQVAGGNIYSNSTAHSTAGGGSCHSVVAGRSASIAVQDGGIWAAGDFQNDAGAAVSPEPDPFAAPRDLPDVPAPDCAGLPPRSQGISSAPLEPGIYSGIAIHAGDWTMSPGMYCLNGDFTVSGGSLRGKGVIIVMNHGSVAFSSSADITVSRPNEYVDGKQQHFPGMLIFMPGSNPGGVDLSGSSGSSYAGTVYAPGPRNPPGQQKCNLGGRNVRVSFRGDIICGTLGIAENAQVTIDYKEEENYRLPEKVVLVK